jgi:hypothetical protein
LKNLKKEKMMKKATGVVLGLFFMALTVNAFAGGGIIDDLRTGLGNVHKAAYDNIWTKPYQAGASFGKANSQQINNALQVSRTIASTFTTAGRFSLALSLAKNNQISENKMRPTLFGIFNRPTYSLGSISPGLGGAIKNFLNPQPRQVGMYMMQRRIIQTRISPNGTAGR